MGSKRTREDIYELISYNIKKYRKERNITQAELAFRSKYTHEYIRRVEAKKSKKYFSIDAICNIADALDIPVSYLFEKEEKEED